MVLCLSYKEPVTYITTTAHTDISLLRRHSHAPLCSGRVTKHGQRFESSPCHVNGNVLFAHPVVPFRNKPTTYQHLLVCLAVWPSVHLFICTTVHLTDSCASNCRPNVTEDCYKQRLPSFKTKERGAGRFSALCDRHQHVTPVTQNFILRLAPVQSP